jgi:ABC-type nitrate/sulfonate/bicarbonate transport system substrate-binding protein
MHLHPLTLLTTLLPLPIAHALKIACVQQWIEHTPLPHAATNFYTPENPTDPAVTIVNGGVANLARDTTIDLAANAETQGLKNYVNHRNYRLIGIVVEATYRLVARKASGISTLSDLRGKRVGTLPGTSAEVFVHQLLGTVGLEPGRDYQSVASGYSCMRAPCAAGSMPAELLAGKIDAFGVWETAVELGVQALLHEEGGKGAVTFKNASVYREVYSLYSTEEKLRNPVVRGQIVRFLRALNQSYGVFKEGGQGVVDFVAQKVDVDEPVLRNVWEDHVWGPGSLGKDLVDYLEREDQYLAKKGNRKALTRAELEKFVDASVYEEAMRG